MKSMNFEKFNKDSEYISTDDEEEEEKVEEDEEEMAEDEDVDEEEDEETEVVPQAKGKASKLVRNWSTMATQSHE